MSPPCMGPLLGFPNGLPGPQEELSKFMAFWAEPQDCGHIPCLVLIPVGTWAVAV